MITLILLLIAADPKPFQFVEEPKEVVAAMRVDPKDDEIKRLNKECEKLRSDLVAANATLQDVKASAKEQVDKSAIATTNLQAEIKAIREAKDKHIFELQDDHKEQLAAVAEDLQSHPDFILNGIFDAIETAKPLQRPVQIIVTIADYCQYCKPYIEMLKRKLPAYKIGNDPSSQIWVEHITEAEWKRRQYTLPHVRLRIREEYRDLSERDPFALGQIFNDASATEKSMPPLTGEQVTGLSVATIKGKAQVVQMLAALEPFLDGGTLQIIYTPRKGVVKDFLTIKRGSVGIKIPPKTTLQLQMKSGDLSILMIDPKPEVIIGPLERGIQELSITPNRISLRLPWMIDPELNLN